MIKINENKSIENSVLVNALTGIMEKTDAEKIVEQLEEFQSFQGEMKRMVEAPDEIQVEFEKKMDKEKFLDNFKDLYFNYTYNLQDSIREANKDIKLTEEEIDEILEIIVKTAV